MEEIKEQLEHYNLDELFTLKNYIDDLICEKQTGKKKKAIREIVEVIEKNIATLEYEEISLKYDDYYIDDIIEAFKARLLEM